jgi:hypothetical protein
LTEFIDPYPELPERILAPGVIAGTFVWAGAKIAPARKIETAIVLFGLWMLLLGGCLAVALFHVEIGHGQIYLQYGGLGAVAAFIGAVIGFLTVRNEAETATTSPEPPSTAPQKIEPTSSPQPPSTALPKTNLWVWRWLMWGCVLAAGLLTCVLLFMTIPQGRLPKGPRTYVSPSPVPTVTGVSPVALPPSTTPDQRAYAPSPDLSQPRILDDDGASDPNWTQYVKLTGAMPKPHIVSISPDGRWAFGFRHFGSHWQENYLYRSEDGTHFRMVVKDFDKQAWKFFSKTKGVKVAAEAQQPAEFTAWDGERLLVSLPRKGVAPADWQRVSFNLRTQRFETLQAEVRQ